MNRVHQVVLIVSTIIASWLGMQAIHEFGHVLGAYFTKAEVKRVVLHPLTISRTDLGQNPQPLIVVWSGPVGGVFVPVAIWCLAARVAVRSVFLFRFFAGFCLVANGAYLAFGSWEGIGDCGELLRNGTSIWQLWLFGATSIPVGFLFWHRQGIHFGLGAARGKVDVRTTYLSLLLAICLLTVGLIVSGS